MLCYNLLGSLKNWEGFQILPYLQTNKLAWHSCIDTGRRNKIPGSKTKGNVLLTAMQWLVSMFVPIPWDPVPRGWHEEGQVTPAPIALEERDA